MTDESIIEYVRKALAMGADNPKIKARLLMAGWPEQDIDEAFILVNKPKHHSSFLVWLVPLVVMISVVFVAFLLFTSSQSSPAAFDVRIDLPKLLYKVDEPISGNFILQHNLLTFKSVVLFTLSQNEFGSNQTEESMLAEEVSFRQKALPLRAFSINKGVLAFSDSFPIRGMYSYSVSIFSCEQVKSALKKACSLATPEDLVSLDPIFKKTEKVVVVGTK